MSTLEKALKVAEVHYTLSTTKRKKRALQEWVDVRAVTVCSINGQVVIQVHKY